MKLGGTEQRLQLGCATGHGHSGSHLTATGSKAKTTNTVLSRPKIPYLGVHVVASRAALDTRTAEV